MHSAEQGEPGLAGATGPPPPARNAGQTGTVVSVNLAQVVQLRLRGRLHPSGINKVPSAVPVRVGPNGLEGDTQSDLQVHGGEFKAVYAYPVEDYRWWAGELEGEPGPGTFGENLTIQGLSATDALIGERWRVGTAELVVSQPREPCWKLGARMDDPEFPRRFRQAGRPGVYFRVGRPGTVTAGDTIEILEVPPHPITIGTISRLNAQNRELANLLMQLCRQDLSAAEWDEVLGSGAGSGFGGAHQRKTGGG